MTNYPLFLPTQCSSSLRPGRGCRPVRSMRRSTQGSSVRSSRRPGLRGWRVRSQNVGARADEPTRRRWPGREIPAGRCEAHHVKYWQYGGETSTTNGVLLCSRHHHFLHRHPDWQVVGPDHLPSVPARPDRSLSHPRTHHPRPRRPVAAVRKRGGGRCGVRGSRRGRSHRGLPRE